MLLFQNLILSLWPDVADMPNVQGICDIMSVWSLAHLFKTWCSAMCTVW